MRLKTAAKLCVCAAASFSLAACGTILYPQRKGQIDGRIDPGVAVLDAVGLLFFIIPGVIAFAVDFSNGTIYLSGGKRRHASLELDDLRRLRFDPEADGVPGVERLVRRETGVSIKLDGPGVRVYRLKSLDDVLARPRAG